MLKRVLVHSAFVGCLAATAAVTTASALTLTLDPGLETSSLLATASAGFTDEQSADLSLTAGFVTADTALGGYPGGAINTTAWDISSSGIEITFDHARAAWESDYGLNVLARTEGTLYFSVDSSTDYLLSGIYSAVDPIGNAIRLSAELRDSAGNTINRATHSSNSTPNETLNLGFLFTGDSENTLVGPSAPITGTLVAGEIYQLSLFSLIGGDHLDSLDSPVTASGWLKLELLPVPEPSTALLLATGLIGLAMRRRR